MECMLSTEDSAKHGKQAFLLKIAHISYKYFLYVALSRKEANHGPWSELITANEIQ